jgi:hypothetical protein
MQRLHRAFVALLASCAASALSGCSAEAPASAARRPPAAAAEGRVYATFTGVGDVRSGTLEILSVEEAGGGALVALPDARPGTHRPNTVELVTEPGTVRIVGGGCGGMDDLEGTITLRSYFAGVDLSKAYVELTSMAPSGYEACNSDAPAYGLSATNGLWGYGSVGHAGGGLDEVSRTWKFRLPSTTTNFTFKGRVMADGALLPCAGGLGFSAPASPLLPSGIAPYAAATGDFNGDGKLDVVIANGSSSSNQVTVLLGAGGGAFQPPTYFAAGYGMFAVAVADMDRDGYLDIVTANGADSSISILFGNGDGTFRAPVSRVMGSTKAEPPYDLAVGDLDGDGYPDIVASLSFGPVAILPNLGGTLGTQVSLTPAAPYSLAVADLNGDGRPDIAWLDAGGTNLAVKVRLNDGYGNFLVATSFPLPVQGSNMSYPTLAAADLDGDGRPELITTNAYRPWPTDPSHLYVLPNNGAGAFGAPVDYAIPGTIRRVVAADLTGDGKADVALSEGDRGNVLLLANDGTGALRAPVATWALPGPTAIVAGDLTGDGRPDLFVASDTVRLATVLRNLGGGAFPAAFVSETGTTADSEPIATAVADLDGDGNPDAVVVNGWDDPTLEVHFGRGDGTFGPPTVYGMPSNGTAVAVADVNRDGYPDVVVANGQYLSIYRGSFGGILSPPVSLIIFPGDWATDVAISDLNGDGWPDLVAADNSRPQLPVFLNQGDGTFPATPTLLPTNGMRPKQVVAADFSGDGYPDLVVNTESATLLRYKNNGNGTFASPFNTYLVRVPVDMAVGDLNGDGWPDLVVADHTTNRGLGVYLNAKAAGAVSFDGGTNYVIPSSAFYAVAVGDVNGDGAPDVVTTTASGTLGVYLNTGAGLLAPMVHYPLTLPYAHDLVLADLDRDFRLDAVVTSYGSVAGRHQLRAALSSCLP